MLSTLPGINVLTFDKLYLSLLAEWILNQNKNETKNIDSCRICVYCVSLC